jgi:hypothetical protein
MRCRRGTGSPSHFLTVADIDLYRPLQSNRMMSRLAEPIATGLGGDFRPLIRFYFRIDDESGRYRALLLL